MIVAILMRSQICFQGLEDFLTWIISGNYSCMIVMLLCCYVIIQLICCYRYNCCHSYSLVIIDRTAMLQRIFCYWWSSVTASLESVTRIVLDFSTVTVVSCGVLIPYVLVTKYIIDIRCTIFIIKLIVAHFLNCCSTIQHDRSLCSCVFTRRRFEKSHKTWRNGKLV